MSELVEIKNNLPSQFAPEEAANKKYQLDAIIKLARDTKNWEALDNAIDYLIDHQRDTVKWWGNHVKAGKPLINADSALISVSQASEVTGFTQPQISRIKKALSDEDAYRNKLRGAAYKAAFPNTVRGTEGTGENEWYTPKQYIAAAHAVLGTIDLDPATSELANEQVQADTIFTIRDNGLSKDWFGNVWMNPPYAQPFIQQFIEKLCGEYSVGRVKSAIALTHNYTDTEWFHIGQAHASAICFTRGRIKFESPTGETAAPTQGQAFFYYGDNVEAFAENFDQFGFVVEPKK